jgi:hypothetical protein
MGEAQGKVIPWSFEIRKKKRYHFLQRFSFQPRIGRCAHDQKQLEGVNASRALVRVSVGLLALGTGMICHKKRFIL